MKEIEVKILNVNVKEVEKKLLSIGAKKQFSGKTTAVLFDFPDSRLRKNKISLRLRKIGKTFLTLKKPPVKDEKSVKVKEELETEVLDFETMKNILLSLGLKEFLKVEKRRTSYSLGKVHFEFDVHQKNLSFIPPLLEIEAKDKRSIFKYAKLLGFSRKDCKPWSIFKLIGFYKKL